MYSRKEPKMQAGDSTSKHNRRLAEKHRREKMKNLYSILDSLTRPPTSESNQEKLSIPAILNQSVEYVNHLKERIDGLKARKEQLQGESSSISTQGLVQPAIVINENGRILEVNLVTGLNKGFMLHKIISILEEEGAEILSANYSTLTDKILYTITSQEFSSRIGIETSRVYERLKALSGA